MNNHLNAHRTPPKPLEKKHLRRAALTRGGTPAGAP
jgi:hypothetical protein